MPLIAALIAGALAMPQPWGQLVRRDHVLVAGMPGCGKTPFAASLAADARRVVYADPTGEWSELGEVIQGDEVCEAAEAGDLELLSGTFRRVVVSLSDAGLHDEWLATVKLCRLAAPHGGLVLLSDEVGDLVRDGDCIAALLALHRNGHKDGIASVLASPCMNDFPKRCRDTASQVFSFYQKNADDRRVLAAEYGDAFAATAATWSYPAPPAHWRNPTLH